MTAGTPMLWEQHRIPLSISLGVGQYDGESSDEDVTKATDQALYVAKQTGKGRVHVFGSHKVISQ